jgi:hypothetical protein
MERYYQVIIKAPININPGDKVYKFMPGESHCLPEHLGEFIFKDGSAYLPYFSLVDIQPPLDVVAKGPVLEDLLKAPSSPALNTLSTVTPKAKDVEKEAIKEPTPTLPEVINTLTESKEEVKKEETTPKKVSK